MIKDNICRVSVWRFLSKQSLSKYISSCPQTEIMISHSRTLWTQPVVMLYRHKKKGQKLCIWGVQSAPALGPKVAQRQIKFGPWAPCWLGTHCQSYMTFLYVNNSWSFLITTSKLTEPEPASRLRAYGVAAQFKLQLKRIQLKVSLQCASHDEKKFVHSIFCYLELGYTNTFYCKNQKVKP